MKRLQIVFVFALLIALSGCKTQEDIRREKVVENLNEQVAQTQKNTANSNSRFVALEEEVAKLTGKIEDSTHSRQQEAKNYVIIQDRLANLEEANKKQTEFIKSLNEKIQDQSKYLEQVVAGLSSLAEKKEAPKKKESKETSSSSEIVSAKNAIAKFKAKDFEESKSMFQSILENAKSKKKDKEAADYYLGMIEYKAKHFEEAKVYFSKLFTQNPDSSFAAPTLLNLAKSFFQLKSKDEGVQTLNELITRFPKSKEAAEGAKLKTKI